MSFTYALDDPTWGPVSQIRLVIGDTVEDAGPLPGRRNYSDQELAFFIAQAGGWQRGAILALRSAAAAWASKDRSLSLEGYSESLDRSTKLTAQADKLAAELPGIWTGVGGLGQSTVKKITDIE